MKTTRKPMLLFGLALLTAVIQGSVFPPEAEAQELSPARSSAELTAIPDLQDLGFPDAPRFAFSPDPSSGDPGAVSEGGSVTNGEAEAAASDEEGAQMEVYYERVTTFGRCWWFCTRIPTFCRCLVIYF